MGEEEEKVEEKIEGDGKDESVNVDELAGIDLDADLHKEGEEEKEDKVEGKAEEKKEEKKPPELTPKEREMEARLARVEQDKRDLQKALHEARQERKKAKEPEAELTDSEILKIIEEHKDDPKVMFNAVKYMTQQMIKKGQTEGINMAEVKNKKVQLDAYVRKTAHNFDDESSESRKLVTAAKNELGLEDHPYGDFLGAAAAVYLNLETILKERFEEGKRASLGDKAEESRKKGIKESQPSGGGPKLPPGKVSKELTADQLDTARRLGLNTPEKLKLYKTQILKVAPTNL